MRALRLLTIVIAATQARARYIRYDATDATAAPLEVGHR
jgi:hypothetical protein